MSPHELNLTHGAHDTRDGGMCLMEAVAWLAGEEHSDTPPCACPVLAAFARSINDGMGEGVTGDALRNKHLAPLAPLLVGTRSSPKVEQARAEFFARWAVTVLAPLALDAAGLGEHAANLRAVPGDAPMADVESAAEHAARAARATEHAAWVAERAAWAAVRAAAAAALAADAVAEDTDVAWPLAVKALRDACAIGGAR